jgi:hypothetical protein
MAVSRQFGSIMSAVLMAPLGHEELSPQTARNARFTFNKQTLAGTRGDGSSAPKPVVHTTSRVRALLRVDDPNPEAASSMLANSALPDRIRSSRYCPGLPTA